MTTKLRDRMVPNADAIYAGGTTLSRMLIYNVLTDHNLPFNEATIEMLAVELDKQAASGVKRLDYAAAVSNVKARKAAN